MIHLNCCNVFRICIVGSALFDFSPQRDVVVRSIVCRFYDDDRKVDGTTPTQALLLRPWIKYFTIITRAWWKLTYSKLKKSKAKLNWKA